MDNLGRLFRPKTIASIGGDWAARVVEQCLLADFSGTTWPINPNRETMHGIPCLPSINDLPEPPDCTFIGVNREQTIPTLQYLAKEGAGGAVCFASGFAEVAGEDETGRKYQSELVIASGSMPILGPNCYGMVNYLDGIPIWPDVHGGKKRETGVAIICQSSNIALNISMQSRGLPLGYVITTGNQAKISMAAIALSLLEDSRVTAIGMYIEGFGNIREFEHLALLARQRKIPIIALKVGESDQAASLTVSHTSSLAGSTAGSRAFLSRLGFGQVSSIPEMVETLKILHLDGPLTGRRVASMSCSGGEACLMADLGSKRCLDFDSLNSNQEEVLTEALGPKVHLANPLDYHTYLWGNEEKLIKVFQAMMFGNYDLVYLVLDFPREDRCQGNGWKETLSAFVKATELTAARSAIVALLPDNLSEMESEDLFNQGIIPLHGMNEALIATETCADIGEGWARPDPLPIITGPNKLGTIVAADEIDIRKTLATYGLTFPKTNFFAKIEDINRNTEVIDYPVVLKTPGLMHKSEHGGVVLNLNTKESLLEAASSLDHSQGFMVEQQISNGLAEILIGVTNDITTGLMLTLGSGGIYSELIKDTQNLLLPTTSDDIRRILKKLTIWPLLEGYRGQPGCDVDCLVQSITGMAEFAIQNHRNLVEIEINPFISLAKGGYAVDILARFTNESNTQ